MVPLQCLLSPAIKSALVTQLLKCQAHDLCHTSECKAVHEDCKLPFSRMLDGLWMK